MLAPRPPFRLASFIGWLLPLWKRRERRTLVVALCIGSPSPSSPSIGLHSLSTFPLALTHSSLSSHCPHIPVCPLIAHAYNLPTRRPFLLSHWLPLPSLSSHRPTHSVLSSPWPPHPQGEEDFEEDPDLVALREEMAKKKSSKKMTV